MPLDELRSVTAEGTYTRYLVLDDDGEQPIGFVHVKDVLRATDPDAESDGVVARDLVRSVLLVPETRRIDEILAEFQTREGQIAVVIDEWGVFEGIVTIEDVLEEIVGDIRDEFDRTVQEPSVERRADGAYVVDGSVPVQEVNDTLGAAFESENETIGGFVFSQLGRVPVAGDEVRHGGYLLEVDEVDDARVVRLVVRASEPPTGSGSSSDDADDEGEGPE